MMLRTRTPANRATEADIRCVREGLARLDTAAAADATGDKQARAEDIFAPVHHAHALDPATTLVLGARGTGKSFWAGVLEKQENRALAADLYPKLNLRPLSVAVSFSGLDDAPVTRGLIDDRVPKGTEGIEGPRLWRSAILREVLRATGQGVERVGKLMRDKGDVEDWQAEMEAGNVALRQKGVRVLVLFDALDRLSEDWGRLRDLIDALMQVAWGLRGYPQVRTKLFLRPDQLDELQLRFVELSKLKADAARLNWEPTDLHGMLFSRLAVDVDARPSIEAVLHELGLPSPPDQRGDFATWPLSRDAEYQRLLFERLAGQYMGAGKRKGRTYDWPTNHLSDGFGDVTPRSFLMLVQKAAEHATRAQVGSEDGLARAITPEGIRAGLRAASRVRIDQLEVEYPWIPRALAPLGGLLVPNKPDEFYKRWRDEKTLEAIDRAAKQRAAENRGFLPPLPITDEDMPKATREAALAERMIGMGILTRRGDTRLDMPDLFRVGAALLKKGGVPAT